MPLTDRDCVGILLHKQGWIPFGERLDRDLSLIRAAYDRCAEDCAKKCEQEAWEMGACDEFGEKEEWINGLENAAFICRALKHGGSDADV